MSKLKAEMWSLDIPPHETVLELGYVCASIVRMASNHLSEITPSPFLPRLECQAGLNPFSLWTMSGPTDVDLVFSFCIVELSLSFLIDLYPIAAVLNCFGPREPHNEPHSASECLGA